MKLRHTIPLLAASLWIFGSCITACASEQFKVEPRQLQMDSTMTVSFGASHPGKFAVRNPEGKWFYLVDSGNVFNLISPDDFKSKRQLSLKVKEVRGTQFVDGKPVVMDVFQKAGTYLLYFADNLETEPENTNGFSAEVTLLKGE